jgi:hypothetical protein
MTGRTASMKICTSAIARNLVWDFEKKCLNDSPLKCFLSKNETALF